MGLTEKGVRTIFVSKQPALFLIALAKIVLTPFSGGADTVVMAPASPGAPAYEVEGEIVDFTGKALTMARPGGTPRAYPADRVLKVETKWNDKHASGRAAMRKRDFGPAIGFLTAAEREEQRVWVRRMIVAELVECYAARGDWERAGDLFIILAQSDPATSAFTFAPLAWFPTTAVRPEKAREWLARTDSPAAVLLGASYLLTNAADSQAAAQALRGLAKGGDEQVAALAESQLWRLDIPRVSVDGVERWEEGLEQIPESLRAGPYFVIGEALARLGEHDRAALAYLRVPVLHETNRQLAARALVSAAQAVSKAGQAEEARRLLNEVVADYADTPQRAEAEALLRQMGS